MDLPEPYDPKCERFARDMLDYDSFIAAELPDFGRGVEITGEMREKYVRDNEGTYNQENGHFLCDGCYIAVGTPSSPTGWKCP
jgi:hypothetical protein